MNKTVQEVFDETEGKSRRKMQSICNSILNEFEQIIKLKVGDYEKENCVSFLLTILLGTTNQTVQDILFSLFQKYCVNERTLFMILSNYFCKTKNLPNYVDKNFCHLPFCFNFTRSKKYYRIETSFGTLTMYCLDEIMHSKIKYYLRREAFENQCHNSVELLKDLMPEALITTSEFRDLFDGTFFHSYYTLPNKEGVFDFANNIFYLGHCMEDIFKPNILLQYPSIEFEDRFCEYKKQNISIHMSPVLQLALYEKTKTL